jgi:hypothetical protein
MRRLQTIFIVGLCAVFMVGQRGCAVQPPALPEELRARLGTIGMVSAQFTPAVEFERPTKDGLGEAPREYAQGIGIVFADMRDLVLVGFMDTVPLLMIRLGGKR